MKPYTYLIKHKPTGLVYYGFRSANKVDPENDLWNKYFTSSPKVKLLLEETGADSFDVQIRKTFDTQKQAVEWETKVLRRCKVLEDDRWINQNIAGYVIPTEESNKKISDYWKGKPKSEEQKRKLSESQKGKPKINSKNKTPEYRAMMSELKKGEGNGRYGMPVSEETRRKIGEANRGKTPVNKGVPMTEEQKAKISAARRANPVKLSPEVIAARAEKQRGQKREKRYCPHCDKDVAVGWYNRHGDNCKHAPQR